MKYTKLFPVTIYCKQYTDEEVQNSEKLQMESIKDCPLNIQHINNQTEEMQLKAIKQDGYAIKYIKKPTKKVFDYMYKNEIGKLEYYYEIEEKVSKNENEKENMIKINTKEMLNVADFFEKGEIHKYRWKD